MKSGKFLVAVAAIAAVSMSSCSQEEELVVNQLSDNAVAFSTYIGKNAASRGVIINDDVLKKSNDGFGVFAYYTGTGTYDFESSTPNFMYNQKVAYSEGAWKYSPVKYWPNNEGERISFFAYAPYTEFSEDEKKTEGITGISSNEQGGDPTLTFALPKNNVTELIDLLYADTKNEHNLITDVKKTEGGTVTLNFKHALSRVNFQWQAVIDGNEETELHENTTITINEITFSAMKLGTSGTLNLNSGEWSKVDFSKQAYTLDSSNFIEGSNSLTGSAANKPTDLTGTDGFIMFIPCETTEAEASKSTITIKYTVSTKDENLKDEAIAINNEATVDVPAISFTAGKAYNFLLKVGLTSVKLEASVADWTDEDTEEWTSVVEF